MTLRWLIGAAALLGLATAVDAQSVRNGIEAWQRSDYDAAVRIWRPLAEKGDADAEFNLAQAYRLGRGVPTSLADAQKWLQRAAIQGHVDAQTTLGLLLFQGGNRPGAIRWLKAAADKSDPRAMLVYGTALFNGDGVKQDAALGYSYVGKAAAEGLEPAKATLAQMDEAMAPADRSKIAAVTRAKPAPARVAAKPDPAKPSPKSPPSLASAHAPASGAWRIQLGAFSQRSAAEALFRKLSGTTPLAGRHAFYAAAGAVTRLQAGPFESRAAAADACRAISARGQACFPVETK